MATGSVDVAQIFVEMADTLVDDFDVVEFLQRLTHGVAVLTGTHSAAVLLSDPHERLQFRAASQEQVRLLEMFQLSVYEGPCVDCFRFAAPVINADLSKALSRWPRFAPAATALGLRSVHAFPLRLRSEVVGSMGLFSEQAVSIPPVTAQVIQALADVATIGILQERAVRGSETLTQQLQNALTSRVVIEQAKGQVAQRYDISIDEAFELMRDYCRRNGLRLSETAQKVIRDDGTTLDLRSH